MKKKNSKYDQSALPNKFLNLASARGKSQTVQSNIIWLLWMKDAKLYCDPEIWKLYKERRNTAKKLLQTAEAALNTGKHHWGSIQPWWILETEHNLYQASVIECHWIQKLWIRSLTYFNRKEMPYSLSLQQWRPQQQMQFPISYSSYLKTAWPPPR